MGLKRFKRCHDCQVAGETVVLSFLGIFPPSFEVYAKVRYSGGYNN